MPVSSQNETSDMPTGAVIQPDGQVVVVGDTNGFKARTGSGNTYILSEVVAFRLTTAGTGAASSPST